MGQAAHHYYLIFETRSGFCGIACSRQQTGGIVHLYDLAGLKCRGARWHDQGFANIIVADYASGCGLTSFTNKPYSKTNPTGPRCDFFDTNANLLARDSAIGFAYRPTDNVGVQYGVNALNYGWISVADFLELNAVVGGFDVDGHPQSQRMTAEPNTLARVYRGGFINSFMGGGLATVPIITQRTDADTKGDIHDQLEDQSNHPAKAVMGGDQAAAAGVWQCFQCQGSSSCSWDTG